MSQTQRCKAEATVEQTHVSGYRMDDLATTFGAKPISLAKRQIAFSTMRLAGQFSPAAIGCGLCRLTLYWRIRLNGGCNRLYNNRHDGNKITPARPAKTSVQAVFRTASTTMHVV